MEDLKNAILIFLVYGVPLILYISYRRNHTDKKTENEYFYTVELDTILETVSHIREQLHRLERLQTEVDISHMDNCIARSIGINWGNREDDEYIMQLVSEDTSEIERLIDKERTRLTTSLFSELAKIPQAVKSNEVFTMTDYERGESAE